ncbi:ankyrin repeat-containing protein ITN1-like [Lotus japonicus]|uniref:ankyrin repeat-containing protein ITN1-like n=1 Tax=Lotus japonicus TaxID=34305 RepID=UPI00258FB682|nr:ankyrin repeat-containing protein ITN1-like [Lotus japonicus]XP_057448685.1 ankyrin repeat-containing protein ITN1-like [Lotus japonicus]
MCIQNSILLKLPGMRKIYDQKKKHLIVGKILRYLRIPVLDNAGRQLASADDAMLQAAKLGIIEFIDIMSKVNPNLLWANDDKQRDIFSLAIMNRRKNVFQLIHDARVTGRRQIIRSRTDVFGNTLLHLAAYLAPSSALDLISSPALQMQREILWFKEVESIVHPSCKEATNGDNKKPHELFMESHKELMKAGEKWTKETSGHHFIIMGTLIITVMFAAAFTVPGGNNQDTGVPLLLRDKIFTVFIISDAISLFTASTSVLLFIGILISGFAENDFLHSLPWKLLFSLLTLYLSVVFMIVAFCASIALIVKGHVGIKIAVMILGCVPVIVLVPSHQRLFLEIFNSTLRSK